MVAIAFDPLEFTQQLEASGMPRAQAEAVAKGLTTMFIHNFDALATKDYLDSRFGEFEARVEGRMEKRFAEQDVKFARINVMLGIVLVAVVMPLLQGLLGWLG